jgi:glycine/D-amino acid oxidase-like deaminating enzyme
VERDPSTGPLADVIVIGGGIVGTAAAAHVAETGRRVIVVERDEIASGASGRNSGVIQHPFDPVLVGAHLETVRLYRRLADASEGTFHLPATPSGLLYVTHHEDVARDHAERFQRAMPELEPSFLAPGEAQRLEPGLAADVAACRLAIGYPVGPARATLAYADRARALGVRVLTGSDARLVVRDGRARGVALAGGSVIEADLVVVAAGPWSPSIVDPTGRWKPIRSAWGVVVTVGLERPPQHVLEEAGIEAAIEPATDSAIATDVEPGEAPDRADAGIDFSLVTADGASSLGSTFLPERPEPAALVDQLIDRGSRFVPAVAMARRGDHRVCARPVSLDGRPLVGPVPGIEGLWIAAGHGPWGISIGPAAGAMIADLLDGRLTLPPAALDPARFGPPPI